VVPAYDLASAVSELAERLAAGPTLAYAAVRRSALFGAAHTLADTMYFEASMMAWTGATTDHRRAAEAFLAKERPVFEGA
jgi:2-(1,2-epoxy-1,2-dihydrophenyl)acetyl-CoA isomerase